jgi:bacterial/archaeal transporter family-2 protein
MNALLSQIGPLVLVFVAGGVVALQAPTNGMLARAGGSPVLAALVSFVVGMAVLAAILLVSGQRWTAQPFVALPWYAWLGGLYGALYVAVAAYAAPRVGLGVFVTAGIAGQLLVALWLDHRGGLGVPHEPINTARLAGVCLVFVGVFLVRRGS